MFKASRFASIKGSSKLRNSKTEVTGNGLTGYHPTGNELSHQKHCKVALTEAHPGKEDCKHSTGEGPLKLRNTDTCSQSLAADGKHLPAVFWEDTMELVPTFSCLITVDSLEKLSVGQWCSAPFCDLSSQL